MTQSGILAVRLGSMGDILHTLPAVATLRESFPGTPITWLVESKWLPLLEENPDVSEVATLNRSSLRCLVASLRRVRTRRWAAAIDFQGLLKSATCAKLSGAPRIYGFAKGQLREPAAAILYSDQIAACSAHVVEMNLELVRAAGASEIARRFAIPPGRPEGELPEGDFVLANPFAGWRAKEWPLERFSMLAMRIREELAMPLVLNGSPESEAMLRAAPGVHVHLSGLAGLIDATRRARAVVGLDSGPMHLAAALGKPGVAIFGPTDPARNGPYGDSFRVVRSRDAVSSYKRRDEYDAAILAISVDEVVEALQEQLSTPARQGE